MLVRAALWVILVFILLLLPLLAMLGSEAGSRWLLEQGVGMQKMLSAQYQSGTWLGGLELKDINIKTKAVDLRINHLLARWSLVYLLRGELHINHLDADTLSIKVISPPNNKPVHLPILIIPFRLVVDELLLARFDIYPRHATHPFTLEKWHIRGGEWFGSRVNLQRIQLSQKYVGTVDLHGYGKTTGNYPISLEGDFHFLPFQQKNLPPFKVSLQNEVSDIQLTAISKGILNAELEGHVQPLLHDAPYQASVRWSQFLLPWLSEQKFSTSGGNLKVTGDATGLFSKGEGSFGGLNLPFGYYQWAGSTDWHQAKIDFLRFSGELGGATASGNIGWEKGLDWQLKAQLKQVNTGKQWPATRLYIPVLTGVLDSQGHADENASVFMANLSLVNGEKWQLKDKANAWPWDLHAAHQTQINWQNLDQSVPAIGNIQSDKGQLVFTGNLQRYAVNFQTDLANDYFPHGQWQGSLSQNGSRIQIDSLHYDGDAGQIELVGEIDTTKGIKWDGSLSVQNLQTETFNAEWPATLTGAITGQGLWGKDGYRFLIEDSHLSGTLRDKPLVIDGALTLIAEENFKKLVKLTTPVMLLQWGANQAEITGGLNDAHWDLSVALNMADLSLADNRLQGRMEGSVSIEGNQEAPEVLADLKASQLLFNTVKVNDASLAVNVSALGLQKSRIDLQANDISVSGYELGKLTSSLDGTRLSHQLEWELLTNRSRSSGQLQGSLPESIDHWTGKFLAGQFSLPELDWHLDAPFDLAWQTSEKQLSLAPHCWVSESASLCNEDTLLIGEKGHLSLQLNHLQASRLASFFPQGLLLTGQMAGQITGEWDSGKTPHLIASLQSKNGTLTLGGDDAQTTLSSTYEHIGVALEANPKEVDISFDLSSSELGQGGLKVTVNPEGEKKEIHGELALENFRIDVAKPFFPTFSTLSGNISAFGRIEGTLQQPEYWGKFSLADGEVSLHKLPINVHNITTTVDVLGTEAKITGSLKSGGGLANVSGNASWKEQPHLNLKLKGQQLELKQLPELLATINPDITLDVIPGRVNLSGIIRLPMGRFNVKTLGSNAVSSSSDVVIVDPEGNVQLQSIQNVSNWLINTDINVQLGDDVFFHGYGVNGRLMGGLHLLQQGKKGLEASGEVELDKDARYDAYGQRLQIRRGRLIFAGNLTQPGLDVEAVRAVDNEVVGVRVSGRVNTPEVTFFSDDGGLSQEEIISYLVLGRPLDNQNGDNNLSAAAAAIKLGATGGAGLTSKLGESLGITDLALDAEGSGDDTQVTVSGYLSPKLYLRYGVGIFTPVNTATLRYKINSKLYLEAISSLENAIDLFYTLRF